MDRTLDAIVEYACTVRIPDREGPVDVGALVSDVVDRLDPPEHVGVCIDGEFPRP